MFLLILLIFSAVVIAIGLVTAKLNAPVPCEHNWVETEQGDIKCTICFRTIRKVHDVKMPVGDLQLVKNTVHYDKPVRPEGIKVIPPMMEEA